MMRTQAQLALSLGSHRELGRRPITRGDGDDDVWRVTGGLGGGATKPEAAVACGRELTQA